MPMKNPPHPGRSVRENCLDPPRPKRYRGIGGSGSCPSYPFAGIERSRGNLARHGHSSREGRMVQRRLLVEPSDCIRPCTSAQG